ncbi:MAG: response regulator, partial [Alphaproteobacteria bacterium]|nr:response regulator [Alphaproteobacteria bacterium]
QCVDTTEQKNLEMRFAHSQKMQAVGQLAGGVAHDFNNLLTAMIGFCDLLLLRHPAGDPSFADIMQIKQNANRAANLVRQLLAFSRRQTLQPKILDLTDVLVELSHLLRRLIGENIELSMSHGRDLGMVKVDQGQLEQVVINLAVNARDAMSRGGTLSVRTSNVLINDQNRPGRHMISPSAEESITNGHYVLFEVIDTGCGIPRELIQQIFEPFFSTKEVGSGTGLGLSTVYGIVKQTGGFIYVSSAQNEGTTFSIYFPRYEQDSTVRTEVTERAGAADLTGSGTILLVEDETPVRIFASRALTNKGYTVLEADSAETALEVIEREGDRIQIIISDVIMPGMTGPEMVEKVIQKYPALKVIFISGYAEDAFLDVYGAEEREFNFLPKPFTLKQLASKVKEVIES